MIIERIDDPEQSIFKLAAKIEKRKGRTHPAIEAKMRMIIVNKLQAQLTLQEFKNLFMIIFCKMVKLP
jgi:hypothetical protein